MWENCSLEFFFSLVFFWGVHKIEQNISVFHLHLCPFLPYWGKVVSALYCISVCVFELGDGGTVCFVLSLLYSLIRFQTFPHFHGVPAGVYIQHGELLIMHAT